MNKRSKGIALAVITAITIASPNAANFFLFISTSSFIPVFLILSI